jgi:hypothetical protein
VGEKWEIFEVACRNVAVASARLPIFVGAEAYVNLLFLAEHHNSTNEWMLPSSNFVQA